MFIASDLPHPAIAQMIKTLQGFPVKRLLLFGSRARGDGRETSDIDLAIDAPELGAEDWRFIRALPESLPTLLKIDIVHLQDVSERLRQEILKDAQVIYES